MASLPWWLRPWHSARVSRESAMGWLRECKLRDGVVAQLGPM